MWRQPLPGERDVLPPFGFLGAGGLPGRALPSCVLVGEKAALATLKGGGLGPSIDAHSLVMRVNKESSVGQEQDLGSKTTVRFTNMNTLKFRESPGEVAVVSWCRRPPCQRAELIQVLRGRSHPLSPSFMDYVRGFKGLSLPPRDEFMAAVLLTHICQSVSLYGVHLPGELEWGLSAESESGPRAAEGKCLQQMVEKGLLKQLKGAPIFQESSSRGKRGKLAFSGATLTLPSQEAYALAAEQQGEVDEKDAGSAMDHKPEVEETEEDAQALFGEVDPDPEPQTQAQARGGGQVGGRWHREGVRRYQLQPDRVTRVNRSGGKKMEREEESIWSKDSQTQAQALTMEDIVGLDDPELEVMGKSEKAQKNKSQRSSAGKGGVEVPTKKVHTLQGVTNQERSARQRSSEAEGGVDVRAHLFEVKKTATPSQDDSAAVVSTDADNVNAGVAENAAENDPGLSETTAESKPPPSSRTASRPSGKSRSRRVSTSAAAKAGRANRREELLKSLDLWDKVQAHESDHKVHKQTLQEQRESHAEKLLNSKTPKYSNADLLGVGNHDVK